MYFVLILQYTQLVKNHGVDRSLLPPKKYFGFLQPEYVEKRRQALEAYFETLLSTFGENLPKEVLEFLETDKFVSENDFLINTLVFYIHLHVFSSRGVCIWKGKGGEGRGGRVLPTVTKFFFR